MRTLFSSWLSRAARKAHKTKATGRRLQVEALEGRVVPSITNPLPTDGSPGPVTLTGANRPDQFVIRLREDGSASPEVQFSDNGGRSFETTPLAAVTEVVVNGRGGKDTLTLDLGNGLIGNPSADGLPIAFDGGPGRDTLNLVGDPGGTITETFTLGDRSSPNTLTLSDGTLSTTISVLDRSPIVDSVPATDFTFNANDNNNQIHLQSKTHKGETSLIIKGVNARGPEDSSTGDDEEDDLDDGGPLRFTEGHGETNANAFAPIQLSNKTNVTVNGLGGDDLFVANVKSVPPQLTQLTLDGGTGFNVLVGRALPAGVTLELEDIQRQDSDDASIFIDQLFAEWLHRPADAVGLDFWKGVLNSPAGREGVIRGIERSQEARANLVRNWYRHFLGRELDEAGLQFWVNSRLMQGASEEEVQAGILGSAEFLQRAQGQFGSADGNEAFLRGVYRTLLNRELDQGGSAFWKNVLQTASRESVVRSVMQSAEFRTLAIASFYRTLLQRDLDEEGARFWTSLPQDLEAIRQEIEESDEFFRRG